MSLVTARAGSLRRYWSAPCRRSWSRRRKIPAASRSWWRQGMMGAANAHYLGIKAFSETDQTEDLKAIEVPTLVMQGDDDQIVPYKDAVLLQAKLIKNSTLRIYPGYPH